MSLAKIVILGPSGGRRVEAIEQAARRHGVDTVLTVNYADLARSADALAEVLSPDTWLRYESPDGDLDAFRALYGAGASISEERGYSVLHGAALQDVLETPGSLGAPAQLAFGLDALLSQAQRIARCSGARLSADSGEISLSYDKTACNKRLGDDGVSVPKALKAPDCYDELMTQLRSIPGRRLFLKLRHGSGAAGTIALAAGPGGRMTGYTPLILAAPKDLRSTKKIRKVTDPDEMCAIVSMLLPLGIHVEPWVPKAGIAGGTCDLRHVQVRGHPPFSVLRISRHPITNLHLDAERAPADRLWQRMAPDHKADIATTTAKVLKVFPGTQMLALDVAVLNDYRRHVVLEVNAFGDHLRRMTVNGSTPQDQQVVRMQEMMNHASA